MTVIKNNIETAIIWLYEAVYAIEDYQDDSDHLADIEYDLETTIADLVEIQKRLGRK